jgi:hypothetical protein
MSWADQISVSGQPRDAAARAPATEVAVARRSEINAPAAMAATKAELITTMNRILNMMALIGEASDIRSLGLAFNAQRSPKR